jgi:hypothetical protein
MMPGKKSTRRSAKGKKPFAGKGRFKDIQAYKRAQAADMRRTSKAESAARRKMAPRSK